MSFIQLRAADFTEVFQVAEVGAGSSVEYLPFIRRRKIRRVKDARQSDRFIATRVVGNSLSGDGINNGDYAICKITFEMHEVRSGRLVIVKTPLGLLIKHFYLMNDGSIRLASANSDYPDLFFELEDVEIQAVVVRTERDWE